MCECQVSSDDADRNENRYAMKLIEVEYRYNGVAAPTVECKVEDMEVLVRLDAPGDDDDDDDDNKSD
mgnify:CR=1 FL=1